MELPKIQQVVDRLQNESEHGCVMLAASLLDVALEKLLSAHLLAETPATIFDGTGTLASFSSKIDVSFYLGLISKPEQEDLHLIRKIRNHFAHELEGLSFDAQAIKQRINALHFPKLLAATNAIVFDESNNSTRWRFEAGVGALSIKLFGHRLKKVTRAVSPDDVKG